MQQHNSRRLPLHGANSGDEVDSVRGLTELTGSETLQLMHAGAAAATNEANFGTISFWRKRATGPDAPLYNLGGPRADQLETEWARNSAILEQPDVYASLNSMAWFPETKLGVNKQTEWTRWKRRGDTTRYLNAVAIELDFHDGYIPSVQEMLARFNARHEQVGLPEPNIFQFSGRGLWVYWLLIDENGRPSVRAWPFQLDLWLNLQSALAQSFAGIADQKVKDVARLTRVPGSTNSATGTVVRAFLLDSQRYTIPELSAVLKVESRRAASRKALTGDGKSPRHQAAGRARVIRLREGLDQILQHCWRGHLPQGHRRDFLWTYARSLRMNRYSSNVIFETLQTLAAAALPPVPLSELKRIVTASCKGIDWRRSFSYKGLFGKFRIQPEQRELITAWVRPQIDASARRDALSQRRLAKLTELDRNVAISRHQGLTLVEIAARLECSPRTVASSLRRLGLTRNSVPQSVQSTYVLEGSRAQRPNTPAIVKFAQIGTPAQKRRRQLLHELDLVHASVRNAMEKLHEHGIRVGRGTVWRDQQLLRGGDAQQHCSAAELPASPQRIIQQCRGDQHAQSDGRYATQTVSETSGERDQILQSVARQSARSAGLLDGASARTRAHA